MVFNKETAPIFATVSFLNYPPTTLCHFDSNRALTVPDFSKQVKYVQHL